MEITGLIIPFVLIYKTYIAYETPTGQLYISDIAVSMTTVM